MNLAGRPILKFVKFLIIICLICSVIVSFATEESTTTKDDDSVDSVGECEVDEVKGRCVLPHRCLSTNPYIEGLVSPQNCTKENGGVSIVPKVCCTDCELVTNASNAVLDKGTAFILWKSGSKSWNKCIEWLQRYQYKCNSVGYLSPNLTEWPITTTEESESSASSNSSGTDAKRKCFIYYNDPDELVIEGGEDAKRGEFPHMVLLGYRESVLPTDWLCSGSLVSEQFVLTAAHCLSSTRLGPVTEIAAGLLKRTDPKNHWHRYRVVRAIAHPGYHPPSKYHDIALLETEKPVEFIDYYILPACLPAVVEPVHYRTGSNFNDVTATGWGSLGRRLNLADTMQKVDLEQYSEEECAALYPPHRHLRDGVNHTTQMCYGHHTTIRDTCGGDSGGPLQSHTRMPTCINTLLGVTSYGHECGAKPSAGIYTRVQHYLPWIESIVWP